MPSRHTGWPPTWASWTTAVSASAMPAQRSSTAWSWSATARITVRMSKAFLRSGFDSAEKISPTVREVAALDRVGVRRDVAVGGIRGRRATRTALPRHDVGVLVVRHEHADRAGQVGRPVLRLPVGTHHPVVAADAVVVLGRDAAGEVERLLAGEHHRALRGHHQDALGVHQHRGLGVPVRLGADVDARDHDVDLAAVLGELHDPAQRLGHPVHVLGAGVHRDARAGGEREPLHGYAETLGQVERRDDAQALLLGDRAQRLRRVAAEHHALHALGVQRRRRGHDGGEDAGRVEAVGPVDRHELTRRVEVVLDERATRAGRARRSARRGRRGHDGATAPPWRRSRRAGPAGPSAAPRPWRPRRIPAGR